MRHSGAVFRTKKYFQKTILLSLIWAATAGLLYWRVGLDAALWCLAGYAVYLAAAVIYYNVQKKSIQRDFISFAAEYGQVQSTLLRDFAIPYALLGADGSILWMNTEFSTLAGRTRDYRRNISSVFPELDKRELPGKLSYAECRVTSGDRTYQAVMQKSIMRELLDAEEADPEVGNNCLISLYLLDETEEIRLREDLENNRIVFGQLSIDNYDEALEDVDELRQSLLLALIERKITKYFTDVDGICRKTENDKYFFIITRKALQALMDDRFSLLEDVKTVNVGNDMSLTISVGVGYGGKTFAEDTDATRSALELALGRGGDQVVVREGYNTRYFGGNTESVEKYTRVKSRVKAQALKEILTANDEVFVMGHKIPDIDAVGAAIGIYRCGKTIGKHVHIVIENPPDAIRPVIESFRGKEDYEEDMFISNKEAMERVNKQSVVVVVDTNKPDYTGCEELLSKTNNIVVLDHHRQGRDIISNAMLSYIEPYASSACEMVTEIAQYFDDKFKLRPNEADALYAGIMVDTSNFLARAGVRTFEAAAYLRRSGADVTHIRKMFRESMQNVRAKSRTIADADIFQDQFAIAVCPSDGLKDPTIVCAQTANELLSVVGVKASFVLTEYNGMIYISARAIDEVNVQLIMERLGGGGHLSIAGAQLADITIDGAVQLLKDTIRQMREEGEIA